MIHAEIIVKYKARNLIAPEDLDNYYGDGKPGTLWQVVEDIGYQDCVDFPGEVIEVRIKNDEV